LVLFAGVVSNFVYNPRKKNQKSAKIIPKIDEAWVLGQLLRQGSFNTSLHLTNRPSTIDLFHNH
ncbi:MAG TPA: hypothetical protein VLE95_06555, partial [Chlamydiales bacterium]|nr:hypothetical protein [Chlamydiales bacterium]